MAHRLAGTAVREEDLINIDELYAAYFHNKPDVTNSDELISFGTSGHRGEALMRTFTDMHVAAITQAVCDYRRQAGIEGLCFVGRDTHALSQTAYQTVLGVLAGNQIAFAYDEDDDFVPTPSVSRAILRTNEEGGEQADGIIITPSHNPPEHGGIKYNPPHGGPAEEEITSWIETRANDYLQNQCRGICRAAAVTCKESGVAYPFKELYVQELSQVIDMELIKKSGIRILVDALGGSGANYWKRINEVYHLGLEIIHGEYDPTFSFMHYDHDGKVRMDCSSAYAMSGVKKYIAEYDIAVGNDPDYDRYGIVTRNGILSANQFLVCATDFLFKTRSWQGKGIGKTVVVTELLNRLAEERELPVFEVPVGFKYFSSLLKEGKTALVGEESAGGSFLQKDGSPWTTDKDGIIMALLAMEIIASEKIGLDTYYEQLAAPFGIPATGRFEAACSLREKSVLKKLTKEDLPVESIKGDSIQEVRSYSLFNQIPLGGVRITTQHGWLVARPSGTENLYKIYGESFLGEEALQVFLETGKQLVSEALQKKL